MSASPDEVRAAVRAWLLATFLPGEPAGTLRDDVSLRTQGVLDSMGRITFVSYLEDHFGVEITPEDLRSGVLDTVDGVVGLVSGRA